MQAGDATDRAEILVGDRVPPVDEFLKRVAAGCVAGVQRLDGRPERDAEAVEVRSDPAGMRVPLVERTIEEKLGAKERPDVRRAGRDEVVDAFGVQVAAESLEVRRELRGVGVVDLKRRVPWAALRSADRYVGLHDLVERARTATSPIVQ